MTHIEKLKQIREREAKAYGKYASKIIERQEKSKIKEDIKRIRGAKLRARFGITKESVEKTGKFMGGLGSGLKKTVFSMGKVAKALGESANEYQKQQEKRLRRR